MRLNYTVFREIVPSSSGEASGVDDDLERMSDEFPPLSPPKLAGMFCSSSTSSLINQIE